MGRSVSRAETPELLRGRTRARGTFRAAAGFVVSVLHLHRLVASDGARCRGCRLTHLDDLAAIVSLLAPVLRLPVLGCQLLVPPLQVTSYRLLVTSQK